MTTNSRSGTGDLAGLMAERQKYEAWIAALAARRDLTPKHVFERVYADYHGRLDAVTVQLAEHKRELEDRIELLAHRLTKIEADRQLRFDERTELELRCAVGELSEAAFEAAAQECDQSTADLSAEAATVSAELDRSRDALGGASRERATVEAHPNPAPAASPPPNDTTKREGHNFDELAFLSAVVSDVAPSPARAESAGLPSSVARAGRSAAPEKEAAVEVGGGAAGVGAGAPSAAESNQTSKASRAATAEAPPAAQAPPRVSGGILHDEHIALGEELVSRSEGPPALNWSKDASATFDPADYGDGKGGGAGAGSDSTTPFASNITGNNPIVLRPSGPIEQSKTLKCLECGAMNYPTEWYCERCGAELASL